MLCFIKTNESVEKSCNDKRIIVKFKPSTPNTTLESEKVKNSLFNCLGGRECPHYFTNYRIHDESTYSYNTRTPPCDFMYA